MTRADFTDLFGTAAHEEVQTMMREDLAEVPADELAAQFRHALDVLEGFAVASGHINRALDTIMNDARTRAEEALTPLEA